MLGLDAYNYAAKTIDKVVFLPKGSTHYNPRLTPLNPILNPVSFISEDLEMECSRDMEFCANLVNTCARYPEILPSLDDFAKNYLAAAHFSSQMKGSYDTPIHWDLAPFSTLPPTCIETIVGMVATTAAKYLVAQLEFTLSRNFPAPHEWESVCIKWGIPHPKDAHFEYPHSAIGNMIVREVALLHFFHVKEAKEWLAGVEGYITTDRWFDEHKWEE